MTATETGTGTEVREAAEVPAPDIAAPAAGGAGYTAPRPVSFKPFGSGGAAASGPRLSYLGAGAVSASLIGLLIIGFFAYLYGFSGLAEAHSQSTLYKTLAGQLGAATAPVGPTSDGAPVAILDIPNLGISKLVIVEGTTSADLTHGPGLVSSSVVPGQAGLSAVYGRASTFGGPFAHLMELNRGDQITVTTGQGTSTYSVETFGDSAHPVSNPHPNQLVLYTAGSSLFATDYEEVSADLVSAPKPDGATPPAASPREAPMAGDAGVVLPLILWAEALVAVIVGAVLLVARRWSPPVVLLYATPVAFALAWAVYENLAVLLPNLY